MTRTYTAETKLQGHPLSSIGLYAWMRRVDAQPGSPVLRFS